MPAYVQSALRPGERIIYQARLSRFLFIVNAFLALLFVSGLAFVAVHLVAFLGKFNWKFVKGPVSREDLVILIFDSKKKIVM